MFQYTPPNSVAIRRLIVEDSEDDALLIQECLAEAASLAYESTRSETLAGALQILDREYVDVVLLDLGLPDSQGLQALDTMRAAFRSVPIVVLTGVNDADIGVAAIQRGAQDFLTKAKAQSDSELLVRAIVYAIERRRMEVRDAEMAAVRDIQKRLFPTKAPSVRGFDISGICHPVNSAGGDYFDFLALPDGQLGIVVADVSGHGLGPALVMAELRAYIVGMLNVGRSVDEVLATANRLLFAETSSDIFVTLFLLRLDPIQKNCRWIGAGHNALRVAADGRCEELVATTLPLAVKPRLEVVPSPTISLATGDTLVLCTDGVCEAFSESGETFGMHRAKAILQEHRSSSSLDTANALFRAARAYGGNREQTDDMTIVVVKAVHDEAE
ncbi:MAG: fused response regulator/phosphatase [Planctomycetales bacterium]|nr:fused response regulator/phosphatase [Planctomycetales bacterium]